MHEASVAVPRSLRILPEADGWFTKAHLPGSYFASSTGQLYILVRVPRTPDAKPEKRKFLPT